MDENEKRLLRQIDAFVKRSHEGILRDMKTLVDIKSVQGEPAPGAPFGTGPKRALEAALEIASGIGLFTRNCEGYVGYADLPGKSEKQIALITHLDVVPEGSGWTDSRWGAAQPTIRGRPSSHCMPQNFLRNKA